MFCIKCGSELLEGSAFCQKCGAPVAAPKEAPTTEPTTEAVASVAAPAKKRPALIPMILQITALALILFSFIMLFVGGTATTMEETFATKGTAFSSDKIVLDEKRHFDEMTFFDRMEYLSDEGFGMTEETCLVIFIAVAFFTASVALLTNLLRGKASFVDTLDRKANSYVAIGGAVFCIVAAVLCFMIIASNDTRYFLSSDYIGRESGYNIYVETDIEFSLPIGIVPYAMILSAGSLIAAGILRFFKKKA